MVEIPAGWSQLPLQVDTPFQLATGAANTQLAQANASSARTKADEEAALAPIQTQLAQNTLATSNAQQPVSQLTALAQTQSLQDNLVAEAASRAQASDNPGQTWRDEMEGLAAQGVLRASQLADAGYSDKLAKTVATFGGAGAGARTSQLASGGPGAAAGGEGLTDYGQYDPTIDRMVANIPPAQQTQALQSKLQTLDSFRQAIVAIRNAPDPIAAWDQHAAQFAQQFGIPNAAGQFAGNHAGLEAKLNELEPDVEGFEGAIQARLSRGALGVPQPLAPAQMEKTADGTYAIRPDGKGGFTSTPIGNVGKSILVGRNEDGFGVYFNSSTGTESVGNVKLDNKPGTARDTATMQKYQLLTAAGVDLAEAGMIVAGGKQMQPADIVAKSQQLATSQVAAEEGGMGAPDFIQKVQDRAAQIQTQLTSANSIAIPVPGAASPGAKPGAPQADYGPTPGKGIDASAKLKQLSAAPQQYQAARAQLVKTGDWRAFDAIFGAGAASQVMAIKNRSAYTGP